MPNRPEIYENRNLLHLLDLTYELEGLLQLMLNRDDDSLPRLATLAKGKIHAISAGLPALTQPALTQPAADAEEVAEERAEERAEELAEEPAEEPAATEVEIAAVSVAEPEDADPEVDETEYYVDDEEPDDEEPHDEEPHDEEPHDEEPHDEDLGDEEPEGESPEVEVPEPEPDDEEPEEEDEPAPVRRQGARMTPVFSINDRFLYARELFGGRVADFDSSLMEVAGMDSYEEAEEYFLTEWAFDPDSPTVKSFMTVIESYFGRG